MSEEHQTRDSANSQAALYRGDERDSNGDAFIRGYCNHEWPNLMSGSTPASIKSNQYRQRLQSYKYKREFLYMLENNQTLIVVGEPGSGKSTQLPQYLYESGWSTGGRAIACTQPRKIAAAMLAQRVAQEMDVELGSKVGYTVGFSNATTPRKTCIKYITEETLIREVLADPFLNSYSVVMVDEAQNRNITTDLLLSLLKKIQTKRKDLRIIISSATPDIDVFVRYFSSPVAVLHISERQFPINIYYLSESCENYVTCAVETAINIHKSEGPGDILVFFPGKDDIMTAQTLVYDYNDQVQENQKLLPAPLFSGVSLEEQSFALDPAPPEFRKIILSTNIAEMPITVEGVVFVIDCGFVKYRVFDPDSKMNKLVIGPISKSSARQRARRAGRTQSGKVYRLYTREAFDSELFPDNDPPEVTRMCPISMLLVLKALGVEDLVRFNYLLSPPPRLMISALDSMSNLGIIDIQNGQLTSDIGRHVAELPLNPELGVCLLNSLRKYNCSKEMLLAAAVLSAGNPFDYPQNQQGEALVARQKFVVREGDIFTNINVLLSFRSIPESKRQKWCYRNFVNAKLLDQANRIYRQLSGLLKRLGYKNVNSTCGRDIKIAQQCLTSGLFSRAAIIQPDGTYKLFCGSVPLSVHPSSVFFPETQRPPHIIFADVMETSKLYIRNITAIEPDWLEAVTGAHKALMKDHVRH